MSFIQGSRRIFSLALVSALCLGSTYSMAQTNYPDRPIKLVIPFAAGGATDLLGRLVAVKLGERLGQPVVVENKPGAGTVLAATQVAGAPADGYTLFLGASSTLVLNPALRDKLGYDPINSFTHLGMLADMQLLMLAGPSGPASMKALISEAKAKPNAISYGTAGVGTGMHFAAEMLNSMAGIDMAHIPFNGSAPNLQALIGGQIPVASDTIVASMPHISAGKVRPLGIFSTQRIPSLPDVPTMIELGYPELTISSWFALMAPKDLPSPVRIKIQAALTEISKSAETNTRMNELGLRPQWASGDVVVARIRKELPIMKTIATKANIQAN